MTRSMAVRPLVLFGCILGLLPAAGLAQETPAEQAPYAPMPARFEAPLRLIDAVRITLENDPNIKLQDTAARRQQGVARQLGGQFDTSLSGTLSYDRTEQELRDSEQEQQRQNRENIENAIPTTENLVRQYDALLAELNRVLVSGPGSGIEDCPEELAQTCNSLSSQLELIDTLISQAQSPNEAAELLALRERTLQTAIDQVSADGDAIRSAPDKLRQQRADLGDAPVDELFQTGRVDLRVGKQFRSGFSLTGFANGSWDSNNYVGKSSTDAQFGGKGIEDLYELQLGFDVFLPLGRGRGSDATGAAEKSAKIDYEASLLALRHQASVSVVNTVAAYWEAKAAADRVEVAVRSVALQTEFANLTRELIQAGEMPRAEEARVLASLADSQARLEGAQRSFHEARVNLARAMGLSVDDADRAPVPADTFLSAVAEGWTAPGADVLDRGVAQRLDHQASLSLQQSGQVLAKGARLDLRPVIDLRATGFYSARGETDLSKATDRWVGPSGRFELSLDVPFKNDTQRGLLIQREADLRRRQIDAADLERTIRLNITRLSGSLALAAQRLARAQEAVRQYDETIAAEQEKLKAGDSTLVDTILTEQQTTGARLTLVDAEQQYANLVAQLRFELGELVSSADGQNRVSEASLVEVPAGLLGGTR